VYEAPQAPSPPAEARPPQRWLISVGVALAYPPPNQLLYAADDAQAMNDDGAGLLGVPADHCFLLLENDATVEKLTDTIRRVAGLAAPQDDVFVFFSGHGDQGPDDNGDEPDGLDEFLVLAGGQRLCDDTFNELMDQIWAEHKILFFDACFAAGAARGVKGLSHMQVTTRGIDSRTKGFWTGEGAAHYRSADEPGLPLGEYLLAASRADQSSFEDPTLHQGVFTYYLLKGLRGEADANGDGSVTLTELRDYLTREIPQHVLNMPQNVLKERQDPMLSGSLVADFRLRDR
jgi:hypothetical protein